MADQLQLRGGTTNEHSTFTGALREVTVDTDKDTLIVHDAATAGGHPLLREDGSNSALSLGTAGTPSIKFTGDTNTGIYSPGADQVAISTGGSARLYIAADGDIGVGTTTVNAKLEISGNSGGRGVRLSDGEVLDISAGGSANDPARLATSSGSGIAFAVNGTSGENLRIDSSGRVGIGTSSPGALLDLNATAGAGGNTSVMRFTLGGTSEGWFGVANGAGNIITNSAQGDTVIRNDGGKIVFSADSGSTAQAVINSSGNVGVGTTTPGSFYANADNLVVGTGSGHNGITIYAGTTSEASICFADGTSSSAPYIGRILYEHNTNTLSFDTGAQQRMTIDSSGRVGVGTSSPSADYFSTAQLVHISGANNAAIKFERTSATARKWEIGCSTAGNFDIADTVFSTSTPRFRIDTSGNVGIGTSSPSSFNNDMNDLVVGTGSGSRGISIYSGTTSTGNILFHDAANTSISGMVRYDHSGNAMSFWTNGATERMRIDSSGRLLVGTSSSSGADATVQSIGTFPAQFHRGANVTGGPNVILSKSRNTTYGSNTIVQNGDTLGTIQFRGDDGTDYQSTGAYIQAFVDGTPGANDMPGRLVFSTTADGASSPTERMRINNRGRLSAFVDTVDNIGFYLQGTAAGDSGLVVYNNATSTTSGTGVFVVRRDGDVENTNNSYGALSDSKLKENIVDCGSEWDDVKALQVRKYNFKEETGYSTHTQLGVVAQEVELVSPGLVSESPDKDAEGNDLGTTTKSVNYSVLYMKAVKALQEAMERIETLEAKVAALEAN